MDEKERHQRLVGFLAGAMMAVVLFQLLYAVKALRLSIQYAMPVLKDIRHELLSAAAGAEDD